MAAVKVMMNSGTECFVKAYSFEKEKTCNYWQKQKEKGEIKDWFWYGGIV